MSLPVVDESLYPATYTLPLASRATATPMSSDAAIPEAYVASHSCRIESDETDFIGRDSMFGPRSAGRATTACISGAAGFGASKSPLFNGLNRAGFALT